MMSTPRIQTKEAHVQVYRSKNGWRSRIISASLVPGRGKIVYRCGQGYSNKQHAILMAKKYAKVEHIFVSGRIINA